MLGRGAQATMMTVRYGAIDSSIAQCTLIARNGFKERPFLPNALQDWLHQGHVASFMSYTIDSLTPSLLRQRFQLTQSRQNTNDCLKPRTGGAGRVPKTRPVRRTHAQHCLKLPRRGRRIKYRP